MKIVLPSVSRRVRALKEVSGAMRGVKDTLYHTWRHGLLYTSYHRYVWVAGRRRVLAARGGRLVGLLRPPPAAGPVRNFTTVIVRGLQEVSGAMRGVRDTLYQVGTRFGEPELGKVP